MNLSLDSLILYHLLSELFYLNTEGSFLVILHDGSLSSDALSADKNYILTAIVLQSVSTVSNLTLHMEKISRHPTTDVEWKFDPMSTVLSFGNCEHLSSLPRLKVPILHIYSSSCLVSQEIYSIPLYNGLESRRDQCLIPEVIHWISTTKQRKNNFAYIWGKNITKRNYHESYLTCLGVANKERLLGYPIVQSDDETDSASLPYSLRLEKGRRFLNGRKLILSTLDRPPFVRLTVKDNIITGAKGFCITMLDVLANKFNFTYGLVLPIDGAGNWGNAMPNGTVTGMIGMVHRKEVDFAVQGVSITPERRPVIAYTHAFYEEPSTILIPAPTEKNNILAFLDPYTYGVWLTIAAAVCIVSTVIWMLGSVCSFQPLFYPYNVDVRRDSFMQCLWDCSFTLVGQNRNRRLTESSRLLMGVWRMASIILIYTYTSILTAFLTVPVMESTISSLEDLVNQDKILWTYRRGAAHEMLFGGAKPPETYYKIAQFIREHPNLMVTTDNEGVKAVLNKKMAFIKEKSFLEFAMGQDYLISKKCRLKQVPQQFFIVGFGFALQQKSAYLPLFNHEILIMAQSGLIDEWKSQIWPKPNECTAGSGHKPSGPKAFAMSNLSGHFLILTVGLLLALLVFLVGKSYQKLHSA